MTQQTSPFIEAKYGWDLGESGWNGGMDENLLKFSFLFDSNVDGIVPSLPPAVNGKAYFLTTDKRIYFVANGSYYSTPLPNNFSIQDKSDGKKYSFVSGSLVEIKTDVQVASLLDSIDSDIASLGTAAFSNTKSSDFPSIKDFGALGDGSDATTALTNALAEHDSVYIPDGQFLIGDVTLNGKKVWGSGTIIKKASTQQSFIVTGNGTVIDGLKFRSQSTSGQPNTDIRLGDGASNVRISNCHFRGNTYSAIYGADDTVENIYANIVDGLVITNNVFEAEDANTNLRYARHIYILEVKNIIIANNIFKHSAFDSVRLRGRNGYCVINANNFTDVGISPPPDDQTRDAVDTYWGGDLLIVSNNTISGTGYIGLDLKNAARSGEDNPLVVGERTRQFIVSNNIIERTWKAGIVISGDDSAALPLYSCIVQGNIIRLFNVSDAGTGTGQSGINIKALARHVKIQNNIIQEGNARGLFVEGSTTSYLDFNFNTVLNNKEVGVVLTDVTDMKIIGNTIAQDTSVPGSGQQATGIIISNTSGTAKTCIMAFNTFKDNGTLQVSFNPSGNRFTGFAQLIGNVESGPGTMASSYPRTGQSRRILHGSATPLAADGTFEVGDILYNVAPTAGGFAGWVCTIAGSPGTWQGFGRVNLSGSATYDPPSLIDAAGVTTTVTVTGATLGDYVSGVSFSLDLQGITVTAWVSSANTVSVRFQNESGSTVDLASGTLRVTVTKSS